MNNRRIYFSLLVTALSIIFLIFTVLGGIHGGVNSFLVILFGSPIYLVWALLKSKINPLIYYLIPIFLLLIGWILLFNGH